ncbi:glycosyltransferase family protein [Pseudomonas oryzae]|uniref:Glycosyl transferases group 1 n=1 Tax=Pseudomonas oryzae TaxID=1392877 RepID=A0A1H1VV11_9PSED|nr:glycosyltransferase [Pseudomonas oryzae]SDS88525.1 Glycosyl transferases group 1 [Pseudomonas oryzae]
MRVLWLIQSYEVHAFDLLAEALREHAEVELVRLDADEQDDLAATLRRFDFARYDRVMTTLRTKKEMRQWRVLRTVPNLVVFEYDACQNYLAGGKYQGRFSRHYRRLGGPRLIVSGAEVARRLAAEGFDAHFLPKGYDSRSIYPRDVERDIFLGFIGRLDARVYQGRKAFIERQVDAHGLQVLRTAPGEDYARSLSRIRIFVSADIGLGEYMAKNFEAMAAGCLLMTYDQGELEDRATGLVDMHNVVLFRDESEFEGKLARLVADPPLVERIAAAGAALARERFAYDRMGTRLADCLRQPLLPRSTYLSWRDRLGF